MAKRKRTQDHDALLRKALEKILWRSFEEKFNFKGLNYQLT